MTTRATPRGARTSRAPLAVASDGTVLVNALSWTTDNDLDAVIEAARKRGGTVFVGLVMPPRRVRQALSMLDDRCAEISARTVGAQR